MLHNIAQPDYEDILDRTLAGDANVDVRKGWTWVSGQEVSSPSMIFETAV